MRDSRINYAVVGTFVLAMIAALLVAIAALTGRTGPTDAYYAIYGNVQGIEFGTKVMFEGYPVGQVQEIEPVARDEGLKFRVVMAVKEGWPIPSDSVAQIAASGLLSAVAIDITGGRSDVLLEPGAEIPAGPGGNIFAVVTDIASEVAELSQSTLKPLLQNLDRQIGAVGEILRDDAPELMANLVAVSQDLAQKTPKITENVQAFSQDLSLTGQQITGMVSEGDKRIEAILYNMQLASANAAQLSQELMGTQRRLENALGSLDQMVDQSQQPVRDSLRDLRYTMATVSRNVETIMQNFEDAGRNMAEFTRELRRNPAALIGGGAGERRR